MTQNNHTRSDSTVGHNSLTQLDRLYLNNPMLMHQLCGLSKAEALRDRIYKRLDKNLKIKKERIGNSFTGRQ